MYLTFNPSSTLSLISAYNIRTTHTRSLQIPVNLNSYRSRDIEKLPFLHVFLKTANLSPQNMGRVLIYLHKVNTHSNPYFSGQNDSVDWTLTNSAGQKAGEQWPEQATAVLNAACEKGDLNVIKVMLDAGTDVNRCGLSGLSPIMLASQAGCGEDIIDLLASHGARVDQMNNAGKNSLMIACDHRHWHTAIALYQNIVRKGADQSLPERCNTKKAFHVAMEHQGREFVQHVAQNDEIAHTLLLTKVTFLDACRLNYDYVVKYYMKHHKEHQAIDEQDIEDGVYIAYKNNKLDALLALLPHTNTTIKQEIIKDTFKSKQYETMNQLLESCLKCQLPCPDISIHDAIDANQVSLVDFLIRHGKGVDEAEIPVEFRFETKSSRCMVRKVGSYTDIQTSDEDWIDIKALGKNEKCHCQPPLVHACKTGKTDMVQCLLDNGANTNIMSNETPLTAACSNANIDIVTLLLQNPHTPNTYINKTNLYGLTPLQVAIQHKHETIAKLLVKNGETQTLQTHDVVNAFQSKQYELVRFFLEHHACYQPILQVATLSELCLVNNDELVQQFLSIHADVQDYEFTKALGISATKGNVHLVKRLLSVHHYTTDGLRNALIRACQTGCEEIVDHLLQHDCELVTSFQHGSRDSCSHPLCVSIENCQVTVVDALRKSGAQLTVDINQKHDLCEYGLRELCTRKAEFFREFPLLVPQDISEESLRYGLSVSCRCANTGAARFWLEKLKGLGDTESHKARAILNDDTDGPTPLHAAIQNQSSELVSELLASKLTDANKTNNDNMTPLYVACDLENVELVSMLITAEANPNSQSSSPYLCSPLALACERNYIDIVDELLEGKTNQDQLVAHKGNTDDVSLNSQVSQDHILLQAHRNRHYEVVRLLLEHEASPDALCDVDLVAACELGYSEVARHIVQQSSHSLPLDVLKECVEFACRNGFTETALEVIIDIDDCELQTKCVEHISPFLFDTLHGTQSTEQDNDGSFTRADSTVPLLWHHFDSGELNQVRRLIEEGVENINAPNSAGMSLLQKCLQTNVYQLIPDLCNAPIQLDINQPDPYGRTALFYCFSCVHIQDEVKSSSAFKYLLEKGADVNVRDKFGRSVVHEWVFASDRRGYGPSADELFQYVDDIDMRDHKGQTPLHVAVIQANKNPQKLMKVRKLLANGSNRKTEDINRLTPEKLAKGNVKHLFADSSNTQSEVSDSTAGDTNIHNAKIVYMSKDRANTFIPYLEKEFDKKSNRSKHEIFAQYKDQVNYTLQPEIKKEMKSFSETIVKMLNDISDRIVRDHSSHSRRTGEVKEKDNDRDLVQDIELGEDRHVRADRLVHKDRQFVDDGPLGDDRVVGKDKLFSGDRHAVEGRQVEEYRQEGVDREVEKDRVIRTDIECIGDKRVGKDNQVGDGRFEKNDGNVTVNRERVNYRHVGQGGLFRKEREVGLDIEISRDRHIDMDIHVAQSRQGGVDREIEKDKEVSGDSQANDDRQAGKDRNQCVFSFKAVLSGSCAECTKVIEMDEADILCEFDSAWWNNVKLSSVLTTECSQHNPSFVEISPSSPNKCSDLLVDGTVSKTKLQQKFYSLIRRYLPEVLKNYDNLYVTDVSNALTNEHSLACINLVWHGCELPWQEFSFDIVPAIPVKIEQLPDATRTALWHSDIIQDLYIVPKTGTFDQSQDDKAFRISFSSTESDMFLSMPPALRHGYMLTKVLKDQCLMLNGIGTAICSYNLKTATFECLKSQYPGEWKEMIEGARNGGGTRGQEPLAEDIVDSALMILEQMKRAIVKAKQMSFFLEHCDLITHSIDSEDYRQELYMMYCTALLCDSNEKTWKELASYIANLLIKPEHLNERYFVHNIKALIDMGLNVSEIKASSFIRAIIGIGEVSHIKTLFEGGASVDDVDGNGTSVYQLAQGNPAILTFLEDNVQGELLKE